MKEDLLSFFKEKNSIAILDFKDALFSDDVFGKNAQVDNLKKWIRYDAVNYGDADIVLKKERIFKTLNWNERWIDCIYSFRTYFNAFLRFYLNEKMESRGYILDHYDEIFSQSKKEQFAEDRGLDIQVLNDLFMELNRFALNTHTIGNYMPCPDGDYNAIKGFFGFKYFQDRLDLLYDELVNYKHEDIKKLSQEKRQSYIKWLDSYKEKLYIENMMEKDKLDYFCAVRGNNRCIINDKKELNNFLNYLKIINPLIEKRGLIIESELKKNL